MNVFMVILTLENDSDYDNYLSQLRFNSHGLYAASKISGKAYFACKDQAILEQIFPGERIHLLNSNDYSWEHCNLV